MNVRRTPVQGVCDSLQHGERMSFVIRDLES
jgi:hypothetical protein